jgi:hypothetical protein
MEINTERKERKTGEKKLLNFKWLWNISLWRTMIVWL